MKSALTCLAVFCAAVLTVAGQTPLFTESFPYGDGALTTVSGGIWNTHSGTAGQVNVLGGQVQLTGSESEDVSAVLPGGPFTSGILSVNFTLTLSVAPTLSGYFIHFKDAGTNFRTRVYAVPSGTPGAFQLGLANSATFPGPTTGDLALGVPVFVSFTVNAATGQSTLSVNGGVPLVAGDATSGISFTALALRQTPNMGIMLLDDITVSLIPEPSVIALSLGGLAGLAVWRRRQKGRA